MFCIIHQYCPKSEGGHCPVYHDITWRNKRGSYCAFAYNNLPEVKLERKVGMKVRAGQQKQKKIK